MLSRVEQDDPTIGGIIKDIQSHPENVKSMHSNLMNRAQSLISGVKVDLDAPLRDEDD